MKPSLLFVTVAFISLSSRQTQAQSFETIWEQPSSAGSLNPIAISPNGNNITFYVIGNQGTESFVWSRDSSDVREYGPIQVVTSTVSTSFFTPWEVSDDGRPLATGVATVRPGDGRAWSQAFSWVDGAFSLLPPLYETELCNAGGRPPATPCTTLGFGVSADGSTFTGRAEYPSDGSGQFPNDGSKRYFLAKDGAPALFPAPPVGIKFVTSGPRSMTADGGMVIGKMCDIFGRNCEIGIWNGSEYIRSELPAADGDFQGVGKISPNGTAALIPGRLWTGHNGCPIVDNLNIRLIPEGILSRRLNDAGSIIVGSRDGVNGIWNPVVGFLPAEEALRMFATLPDGWQFLNIADLSADGNVWMGSGLAPNGNIAIWRASITESSGKRLAAPTEVCSDQIEIHTPTRGEFLGVDDLYEVTWSHIGTPDPLDELIISYSDFYDEELGSVFPPTVIDTISGAAERYLMTVPNASSKKSAILISRKSAPLDYFASEVFTLRGYDLVRETEDDYEPFRPSIHGWPFSNGRSNLFPSTWYGHDQFDYGLGEDPFTGRDYSVNFTFPPVNATPDVFPDWPSFVRAFETDFTYLSGPTTFPPSGYRWSAVLSWGKNHGGTGWSGSCAGMSTTALMKFSDPARFDSLAPSVGVFGKDLSDFDVSRLGASPTTGAQALLVPEPREIINARQQYWDGSAARTASAAGTKHDVRQLLVILKSFFLFDASIYPSSYLYIRNEGCGSGAHAIVPYRLERVPDVEGRWKIMVYDPNEPQDDDRFVEIDSVGNEWVYDGSKRYCGGKGSIFMMDPIANYFDAASYDTESSPKTTVPAASSGQGLVEIGVTPGAQTTIRGPGGQSAGFVDGAVFDNLESGFVDLPPVGGDVLPRGYVVPVGSSYSVEISSFPDSVGYVQISDASHLYNYSRTDAGPGQRDRLVYEAGGVLAVRNEDASNKNVRLMGVLPRAAAEILIDVDQLQLSGADSVRFAVEGEQLRLHNQGTDKTYDLHLELGMADGQEIFLSRAVPLGGGAIHHTTVDWDAFGTGAVRVEIDVDADGTIDSHVDLENEYVTVDAEEPGSSELPTSFSLAQNYPNPFNPKTTIEYALPRPASVRLTVYDVLGRAVATVLDKTIEAGKHSVAWDARDLPSGVYLYRMRAGDFVETRSMVVLK